MEQLRSLADLLDLHEIDLQIDRLLETRSDLPELEEYKAAHETVADLTGQLDRAKADLDEANKGLRRTNGELELAAEKASSEQNRLYAGGLSAKDADYLRREVEMLYEKVSKMEDDVLAFMEAKEVAESEITRLTSELGAASERESELAASIRSQWKTIDAEIAAKEERKATAVSLVDPYLLEVYDDLREHREGRVVGRLADGVCGSCHLQLSAAEVAQVSKEDPPRCIHCRSILVV